MQLECVHFRLASLAETYLRKNVAMIGFPLVWDQETEAGEAIYPFVGNGRISAMDGSRRAVASYDGGKLTSRWF